MRRYFSVIIALCLLLIPALSTPVVAAWTIDRAEAPHYFDNTFGPRALALDSLGRPHIAYGGDNLYHAWYNGTSWTVETIPDWAKSIGQYASIAIDSSDHVHISCFDATGNQLTYATNASGSWVLTTVTSSGGGMYSCIAINPSSGLPAIVSVTPSLAQIVYSETDGANWTSAAIHTGADLHYTTLAFDGAGNAHAAFVQTNLYYMNNVGGSWAAAEEAHANPVVDPCLALDLTGQPHISTHSSGLNYLIHVYKSGSSWISEPIDATINSGDYSSIAVDSTNFLHVSYYKFGNEDLGYAFFNGAWNLEEPDTPGTTGLSTSIAVNSSGRPHISFLKIEDQSVRYAEKSGAAWTIQNADRRAAAELSAASSMDLDSAGKAHLCFYDSYGEDLYYSSNQTGAWVKEQLDNALMDAGRYSTLAVDSTGLVHIVYRYIGDVTDSVYITGTSGTWSPSLESIDAPAGGGQFCQLALDPANSPHVTHNYGAGSPDVLWSQLSGGYFVGELLYSSAGVTDKETPIAVDSAGNLHVAFQLIIGGTDYYLVYGKYNGTDWVFEDVVASGAVGDHCSIAVDSAGYAHISFFNSAGDGYLTYATNKTGAWVVETVDPVGVSGVFSDIAVDSEGYVHIAYSYDGATLFLKYATNKTGSWALETVDNAGDVGEYCTIALDSYDLPNICYSDTTNYDIKYARIEPPLRTLNVAVSPTGGGTVTGSGINCPGDCTETYLAGTPVELTAAPAANYSFDHWTGALTGTANPQSLTMDGDKTVTAVFLASTPPPSPQEAYSVTFPAGSTANAFRIMAMPLVPDDSSPAAVLGSQIGTYDPNTMRIGYWNPETQSYVEYPFNDPLEPGRAGWFLFRNGKTLTVEGSPTPLTSGLLGPGYYYPINQGWNMMGNPCLESVDLIDAMVIDADSTHAYLSDPANTITQQVFWVYGNGTYRAATTLGVTEGGWIKKLTPGWGRIFIPAAYPDRGRAASVPVTDDLERPPAPPAGLDQPSAGGGGGGGGCFVESAANRPLL